MGRVGARLRRSSTSWNAMNRILNEAVLRRASAMGACIATLLMPLAHAAHLSQEDYEAGRTLIASVFKADEASCASRAGNALAVCTEQAKAKRRANTAELDYSRSGTPSDLNSLWVVKASATFAVARQRCDDLAGRSKDLCVTEAQAQQTKSLADAKLGKAVGDARRDAEQDKRYADFQVASQKCDALAGAAKSNCQSEAKARFGGDAAPP